MQQVFLSSSSTDIQVVMGNVMDAPIKPTKIKIDSFEWFNLYQNVSSSLVLNFNKNPGAVSYSITIPPGNYTADELAETIQSLMNTAVGSSNFTVSYNTKTFKFDFNSLTTFQLVYAGSTAMNILGFLADSAYALSLSSTLVCDLSPIDAIYVECSLVNDGWKAAGKRGILGKIQVDRPPGQMIFFRSTGNDDWVTLNSQSNTIRIRLMDNEFNTIPSWGINWNMCLKFE